MLNNFYQNNSSTACNFYSLIDSENKAIKMVKRYVEQIKRNFLIGQMETYRISEAQSIPVLTGLYTLPLVLSNSSVESYLGQSGMTLTQKIAAWESLDMDNFLKIGALDIMGYYIALEAITIDPPSESLATGAAKIVSMDVYDKDVKYQIGVDFDIANNRLYLLSPECYSISLNSGKSFLCQNIAIDFDTTTRYIGANFNLPEYSDFSKDVYNDMVASLTKAALAGPSIKNMRAGIDIITGVENSSAIYDRFSANNSLLSLWNNYSLTPFDFVIQIPAEYMNSDSLSDIIKRYIDTVKLAESNYVTIFNSISTEDYSAHISVIEDTSIVCRIDPGVESYKYIKLYPQTNNTAYLLNQSFTTGTAKGYSKDDEAFCTITNLSTLQQTVVQF